jgi:protein-disulfide isomerase-like protein with CxxC motif
LRFAEQSQAGRARGDGTAGTVFFAADDVASYLRQRHIADHASVNTIATEVGLSFHTVKAALQRHQITVSPHATKRHILDSRTREVAAELGADSIADFVKERLAMGRTWRAIAAETGQPESWLRRQCASRNSGTSA